MQAKQKVTPTPCSPSVPGALPGGLIRTRFYDGMLLTQADLEREQNYWRMKRKLTNRALGTGVVWGLRLRWDGAKRQFHLGPGYALDCCGNDLVVECPQQLTERSLIDKNTPEIQALLSPTKKGGLNCPSPDGENEVLKACVVLKYTECAGDLQPIHQDSCTSSTTYCEYASVRETATVALVPEPSAQADTPLEAFCDRIRSLSQECAAVPECTLFDSEDSLAENELPILVDVHVLSTGSIESSPAPSFQIQMTSGSSTTPIDTPIGIVSDDDKYYFSIRPVPGCVFGNGEVNSDADALRSPFGIEVEVPAAIGGSGAEMAIDVKALEITPLFSNGTRHQIDLSISISTDANGERVVSASTSNLTTFDQPETCNTNLNPLLFLNGDPSCLGKALAMSLLSGWFKGLLQKSTETSAAAPTPKHVAAWMVCYSAWKILFKANLNDPKGELLNQALKRLTEEWCAAFSYPGPYCTDSHHGVYLGCVELSKKGNILSFEPWKHRRYVITGPLVTHWMSLFGLAPLDVTVGRIARWMCCLSEVSLPALSLDAAKEMMAGFAVTKSNISFFAGSEGELEAHLAEHRLARSGDLVEVTPQQLVAELPKLISTSATRSTYPPTLNRKILHLKGTPIFILAPSYAGYINVGLREELETLPVVENKIQLVSPLGRSVARAFVHKVASTVELKDLAVVNGSLAMRDLLGELASQGVRSVADYLVIGPEKGVQIAEKNFDELDHIETRKDLLVLAEELAIASEAMAEATMKPFVEKKLDSDGGPLRLEHLEVSKNIKTIGPLVRQHLKRNKLTNQALTKIAKELSETRGDSSE